MTEIHKVSDVIPFQKPQDAVFAKLFTRKLSRVLTFLLLKFDSHVTPNQVSFLSFLLTILACILFLDDSYGVRFAGAVLLQIAFAFDCSDGEVSRIKNLSSPFGAWLDSVFDRFKELLMIGSLTLYWYIYEDSRAWVLLVGFGGIIGLQLVSYIREAKKSSWPSTRVSEIFVSKNMYLGTVDSSIYLITAAVVFNMQIIALWIFFFVSIPLLTKQILSAYRLGKQT